MTAHPLSLAPENVACKCVARHQPDPGRSLHAHHVVPLAWNGPDTAVNLTWLCPTSHNLAHVGLRLAVRLKRKPKAGELAAAGVRNRYVQALVLRGVDDYLAATGGAFPTVLTDPAGALPSGDPLRAAGASPAH